MSGKSRGRYVRQTMFRQDIQQVEVTVPQVVTVPLVGPVLILLGLILISLALAISSCA